MPGKFFELFRDHFMIDMLLGWVLSIWYSGQIACVWLILEPIESGLPNSARIVIRVDLSFPKCIHAVEYVLARARPRGGNQQEAAKLGSKLQHAPWHGGLYAACPRASCSVLPSMAAGNNFQKITCDFGCASYVVLARKFQEIYDVGTRILSQ